MEAFYKKYKDKADFKIIYIREAHPADGWRMAVNDREGIVVNDPKSLQEREGVASVCATSLKISIPILIDGMDNKVEKFYQGWPDRIYIVSREGIIYYQGRPGPMGFKPKEAENALQRLLAEPDKG
ncbi:MAG: hypothetical protein K6T17_03065 [Fimbriimonadales bacterium]|nr:hypothetical protein [Fimbriimonadales bacterium]